MMMISNFFYYVFFASAVFIYGIGVNRSLTISEHPRKFFKGCIKLIISVSASTALTYLVLSKILMRASLTEVYPFVAVLIFSSISIFIESVVRITSKNSMSEYAVAVLSVLLGINESISIFESVIISLFCILSFFVAIIVMNFLRKKFNNSTRSIAASIAIILIIALFWNVSWFAQGVYQR